MNKFNKPRRSWLKEKRAKKSNLRRLTAGDSSLKVPISRPNLPVSGKRQRKLIRKWHREQKNSLESGLVTMEDVEMMAADSSNDEVEDKSNEGGNKQVLGLSLKKKAKLRLKKSKKQEKQNTVNEDAMMQ